MSAFYDLRDVMLDVDVHVCGLADEARKDALISRYTSDPAQSARFAETCIDSLKALRSKIDEVLAQAEQAKTRRAAA